MLMSRWRRLLKELPSAKHLDTPTLNDHIPALLDELAGALHARADQSVPETGITPPAHGLQRWQDGFEIEEVVTEYNILRGCIHDLADQHGLELQGEPFHIINYVLDEAIGMAVRAYTTQQALDLQHRREEYLAFVAHDLRTPLNAISLAARVLELTHADQANSAKTARMFNTLRRNVQNLSSLVGQVLEENTSMQTESGVKLERRELDLWPLVEALVHDLHPVAGTGSTRLINDVPDDLVIYADANLLRRMFQNLIANAIKYTPRGEVVISAHEVSAEGAVECWVSDNGAGIPPDLLDKIFDKFEGDPDNAASMGLGLAIFKTFVEAHDGTVSVESKPGVGSTFRFTLPARRSKP